MIRRERRDGGEGEERGLRKGAERGYRDSEKTDKRELSQQFEEEDKEHRHLPLLISRHCVSSEFPTRFCSIALQH